MPLSDLVKHLLQVFSITYLRYIIFAGVAYLIFYVWRRERYLVSKIQVRYPQRKDIIREILYSTSSMLVFATVGAGIFWASKAGFTKMYFDFHAHSFTYFLFTVALFILLHDAYFYWTHRLMHWNKIYKYVHRVHHLSTNPTPWAAFAFHPLEAVIEIGIVPIMVFLVPIHPIALLIWVLYMTLLNVIGHLGFELFPSGFTTHAITRWHNTSVHHNMHHRYVKSNYGLYFNIWDRIMGTNHAHYDEEFEKLKQAGATNHVEGSHEPPFIAPLPKA